MIPQDLQHLDADIIAARYTIKFSARQELITLVTDCANERGINPEQFAARLTKDALELFDEVIDTRSPSKVLAEWMALAEAYARPDASWSFVTQRTDVMKTRLAAGEFEMSTSDFTHLLLAKGIERYLNAGN
jgi:hypothetical protein